MFIVIITILRMKIKMSGFSIKYVGPNSFLLNPCKLAPILETIIHAKIHMISITKS